MTGVQTCALPIYGLIAWSVMGRLLSGGRVATPHLQTGRASYLSTPRALGGGALPRERFSPMAPLRHANRSEQCLSLRAKRKTYTLLSSSRFDPARSAPGSWQRIGGASPPRGRSSQPPRPQVMHEVLLARAAVKRSQGRPWAGYRAAKRVQFRGADPVDRKSTRLNSSHRSLSRMPSSA